MHYHLKGKYASYESQPENDPKQNVTRKSLSSWKSEIIAQRRHRFPVYQRGVICKTQLC